MVGGSLDVRLGSGGRRGGLDMGLVEMLLGGWEGLWGEDDGDDVEQTTGLEILHHVS